MTSHDIFRNVGAAGSSAVIAVTGIHPIDVVKTRIQVSQIAGIRKTVTSILQKEGVAAFWKGIGAAWLRESSYTSLRLGLYTPIKKGMGVTSDSSFFLKFTAGSLAGAIGSLAGNPFDVIKTRMMTNTSKTSLSMMKTAYDIYKYQTYIGFYRGLEANMMRACVLNGTKMSCYDEISYVIKKSQLVTPGLPTQFVSAFGAGFFMATTVAPFDMIRTQLMNQPSNEKIYKGFTDCLCKLIQSRGVKGLYAGFIPIWVRFAPTTCLQLIIFEQLKPIFGVAGNGE